MHTTRLRVSERTISATWTVEMARRLGQAHYKYRLQLVTPGRVLEGRDMSATKLTLGRGEDNEIQVLPISHGDQFLLRRLGVEPREQRCPQCNSLVYTRRHRQCGVCEQVLPLSFLFSNHETQKVDRLLKIERQRHRAWLNRSSD